MNKIYRLVWNKSLNIWTVVSENARGVTKKRNVAANTSIKTAVSLSNSQYQHVLLRPSLIVIALSSVFFSTGAFAATNTGGGASSNGSSMAISPSNDQCSGMGGQASITNGTTGNGGGSVAVGCGNNISGTDSTWQQGLVNRRGTGNVAYGAGVPTGNTGGVLTGSTAVGRQNTIRGGGGATVVGTANNSSSSSNFHNVLMGQGNSAVGTGGYNTLMGVGNQIVDDAASNPDGTGVGTNSIAIGIANRVTGQTSIAFGRQSYADADYSIAQGNVATVNKGATGGIALGFSATVDGKQGVAIGSASGVRNYDPATSARANEDAVAVGTRTNASTLESVAIGAGSEVTGTNIGLQQQIGNRRGTGTNNYPSGAGNYASRGTAVGQNNKISNLGGGTAIGSNNTISPAANPSSAGYNIVIGQGNLASDAYNTALGIGNDVSKGTSNTAIGVNNIANGNTAIAMGRGTNALADFSIAQGNTATVASGATGGIALGNSANTTGVRGIAIGSSTGGAQNDTASAPNAIGTDAIALGTGAKGTSDNDIAIGRNAATAAGSGGDNIAMGNGVVTGATGKNVAIGSEGTTANSRTGDGGAVSIGRGQRATGDGAVAIGDPNVANGDGAIALGKDNIAAGDTAGNTVANGAVALGYENQAIGQGSVALGHTSVAAAAGAIALGDNANAQASRGVALGSNAVATNANDVALGSGSVTSAANPTSNGTVGDITYNYAGTSPSSVVSVGSEGNERQITNVAAGRVSETSTDAINGSQLYSTQQALGNLAESTANHLGGGSTVNPDGSVTAPSYTVNGNNVTNVGAAISELDKGWNLQSNGANGAPIKAGDTVDIGTVAGEENLTVTKDGNNIKYGLNRDLKVDSVRAGDTLINDNGVTIANGPSITKSGINAAGNPISNVGAGVEDTDAVNKGQLDKAAAAAKTEVTQGKNITVTKTTGLDGQDIYNVATADNVDFNNVTVGGANGVNIDGNTGKISGVTAGEVSTTSDEAINGSQLAGTAKSVSDALGGGSTVNPDGTVTAPSYTVNGETVRNVGDAITELDKGWNLQSNGANAGAIRTGDTVDIGTVAGEENLTVTKDGNNIKYGLNRDLKVDSVRAGDTLINDNGVTIANGPSITKSGINAAGNPISNVGAGVDDTDAVNKGQLDKAAAAAKTEVTQGKNITVSKTTGADGQDIYNVATADNVDFNNVTVGGANGVNIDGTTGKVSGVTAGEVSATSDEAINGSQLAGTAKSVSDALGGGSTVNPDGTVTAPSYTVNGETVRNVGDAITELDKGWNLQTNGANAGAIRTGDTVDIGTATGEENLTVSKNGNTIQYGLNKDLKVDRVTAGDTVINTDGVTISNGPSITKSGINAAGNPISNVGAGVDDTDAVNKGQLDKAAAAAKTEVTQGKNITVSKTTGADGQDIYNVATADNVDFNNVTVGGANGVSIDGTTGKISGVTAGEVSTTSDEAINGSQLAGTAKSVSDALGGGSTVNPDGTVTAPSYTVNGNNVTNVGAAISELDKGWNLQTNGANAGAVKAGDTVDIGTVAGEENLTVTKDGNNIKYGLNRDLKVDSVRAGDTLINDNGVTIVNGPSITKSGINAAGNPISNVDAGVDDTDAVNKGQLDKAAAASKTEVTQGKNITVTKTTGLDGQDIYNVATADNVDFNNVTVGGANGVNIDGTTGKISGVTAGEVSATSDEAINGSQLAGTAKSVSDALGGGSTVNPDGTVTAPSYTVNGNNVSNVGAAISELDKGWNLQSNGAKAGAVKAGDAVDIGTVAGEENLTVTKDGNNIKYGLNRDLKVDSVRAGDTLINDNGVTIANGPSITKSGINAAGNPISNVGAGVDDTDAVNKGQLDKAAAASKTEVTQGKNITVSKTRGADGQDIYNVATADDVSFDSVQVGDVNIDGTTGKISGVADGTIAAGSKDAVNGSQLNDSVASTGDILGGGVTNEGGKLNGPFTVSGKGYDTVADAIQGEAAAAKTEVEAGKNMTVESRTGADGQTIYEVATADDVSFDSVQVGDVNIDGTTGKISGVTDGTIAAGSKDAVNGGQLHGVADSVRNSIGGETTLNPDGSITTANVGNTGQNNIHDAIDSVRGQAVAAKTEVEAGKNMTVESRTGTDGQTIYEVATADDVDSVQVGDVNIDAATGKISGVADGTVAAGSKDAVNGGQLNDSVASTGDILGGGVTNEGGKLNGPFTVSGKGYDTVADAIQGEAAAAKTEVTEGKNITVTKTTGADGQDIYNVATKDDVSFDSVQVGDVNIDGTTGKISGVTDGTIAAGSKDAVNGGQLHGVADSVCNSIGGETTLNPDGSITTGNVGNTGQNNIHDAIDSVRGAAVAAKTEVEAGKNMTVESRTGAAGQTIYEVATADDVDFNNVTVGGANGVNIDGTTGKISGVADGTVAAGSKDAVNGGQLNDSVASTGDILGGGVTNEGGKLNGPFTVSGKGYDTVADAIQGEAAAAKTEVTEGKNVTVTKTTGADGQDIYNVATKDDVSFDSVQVGDVNIDGTTGKISGVADGTIAAGSKDAVNGGQIHGIADSVKNSIGGETTLNPDGSITTGNVGNTGQNNIHDAIDSVRGAAVAAKTEVEAGKNMTVESRTGADGQTIYEVATADDVDFNNITVGGANGVNIDGTTGKISGVADGTVAAGSKDAVNGGQLNDSVASTGDILGGGVTNEGGKLNGPFTVSGKGYDTVADAIQGEAAAAKTEVTEGKNITVTKTTGADGQDIYNVETKDHVSFDSVQVGDVNIDGTTGKISGVTDGTIAAGSKDAVNGGQLHGVADSVRNSIGGETTLNLDGSITTANVGNTGQNNIHDAIDSVRGAAVAAKTEVEAGKNMTVESRTGADGQTIYEVATADDVDFNNVTVGGANGVNIDGTTGKISGVADGTIAAGSKDAINGGQLNDSVASTGDILGGGVTNEGGKLNGPFTVSGKGYDTVADAIQGEAAAAKTEVTEGKNVTVTKTTGADGQDIYNVATKDDVSFDSVQVGDVNIDGTTGKISGVTDGTVAAGSKDAVNGGQLNDSVASTGDILGGGVTNEGGKLNGPFTVSGKGYDTVADAIQGEAAAAKTEVTEGKNVTVTKTTGADGQDIYNVATKDDVSFDSVQVGDVNIDGVTGKISGVADGTIAAGSTEAINGGQLHGVADSVKTSIGGKTSLNPDGSITTSDVGNTGKNNIHDAIDSVRGQAVAAKTTVTEGDNIVVTQSKNADGSTNYEVATAKDVKFDSVTATDADGNETILDAKGVSLKDQAGNTTILGQDGLGFADPMGNSVGPRISARGIDAGNTVITGVAPGRIATDSQDAINGSQLKGVADSVAGAIGGNTTVNPDGSISTSNIGGTGKDNINDAIGAVGKAAQEAKTTVSKAAGDENVTVSSRQNADGSTDYEVGLSKDVKVDSVTAGDTVINGDGLTIAGGPSVTKDGIDAGDNKVTGVADGTIAAGSKDAINGGQLHGVADSVKNVVGGNAKVNPDGSITTSNVGGTGKNNIDDAINSVRGAAAAAKSTVSNKDGNISVNETTKADGSKDYEVGLAKDIQVDSVTAANQVNVGGAGGTTIAADGVRIAEGPSITKGGIDAGSRKVTAVAEGAITPDSKDAINGSQLHKSYENVAKALGGGAGYDPSAGWTAPSYEVAGGKHDNVGDALNALNNADQALGDRITNLGDQMQQAFYDTNQRIDDVKKMANAGVAAAMALETAPYISGKYTYAVGAAYHGGENAVGLTLRKTADNGRWSLTTGVAAASQGDPSFRVGLSGVFD
ncbi:ESPR-type extended signal peptide-containing protein [Acinetobacter sp. Marseille-P8610]|uniref:ESPR-type extended signal peptide-containing protein n=1 Tax=Acinetobacter sp. Marseille-P8610 TaxID=2864459 RepID=UPI001CE428B9|nr:ESPR-type extended signal peptide-containing protein [Acinetobacter sp. Marseille-P8610]